MVLAVDVAVVPNAPVEPKGRICDVVPKDNGWLVVPVDAGVPPNVKVELSDEGAAAAAGVFVEPKRKPEVAGVDVFVVVVLPNAETKSFDERFSSGFRKGVLTCRRRCAAKGERTRSAEHFSSRRVDREAFEMKLLRNRRL